jgi:hypothetical protein
VKPAHVAAAQRVLGRRRHPCLDPFMAPVVEKVRRATASTRTEFPAVVVDGCVLEPIDDYTSRKEMFR